MALLVSFYAPFTNKQQNIKALYLYIPTAGLYAIFVPFFNAAFHGRIARFQLLSSDLTADLQELVLTSDRKKANVYKGYRGGFVSIWQGVDA